MKKKQILTDEFMHTFREVVMTIVGADKQAEQAPPTEGFRNHVTLLQQIYHRSGVSDEDLYRFSSILRESLDGDYRSPK